jgi:NADPH2:quinone reductase
VLQWIAEGSLHLQIDYVYPLSQAAKAHQDLEARLTTGKLLLLPE